MDFSVPPPGIHASDVGKDYFPPWCCQMYFFRQEIDGKNESKFGFVLPVNLPYFFGIRVTLKYSHQKNKFRIVCTKIVAGATREFINNRFFFHIPREQVCFLKHV